MKEKINPLNSEEIEALKKDFELLTFPSDFDLVYEDQVPNTGIALIEGAIELVKKSKVKEIIKDRGLIGIAQLLDEKPVKFGLRVKANSKIILLGKSDILSSKLSHLMKTRKTG